VRERGRQIVLGELGRRFVRNVAMVFDAHLPSSGPRPIFSATV
jgi:hypothetical protein